MYINSPSLSQYAMPLFGERILPSLTAQQSKIFTIVSACLVALAVLYVASRSLLKNKVTPVPVPVPSAPIVGGPHKQLDCIKIKQEAEKQFASNPYKDKIVSQIEAYLKQYAISAHIVYDGRCPQNPSQEDIAIRQAVKDFFGRSDLFDGVQIGAMGG